MFVYSGVKGVSILTAIQDIVTGKNPGTATAVNAVTPATPAASSPTPTGVSPNLGGGTGASAGSSAATYQAYAFSLFPQYGWGTDQEQSLISLWNGESGWDPTAYNPGTHTTNPDDSHAFGIPQALPASKMASAGSDWRTNAATQIRWGLGYIHDTYGSPANAYNTWLSRSPHWY
jgi:hypothetical protein